MLSFDDADLKCSSSGGRLYQPRVAQALQTILTAESQVLAHFHLWADKEQSFVAIGIKVVIIDGEAYLVYRDGTPVDNGIIKYFPWVHGHPDPNVMESCVGLVGKQFKTIPCSGYSNGISTI